VGSQPLSIGKRKGRRNTKNGNKYARLKPIWNWPTSRCAKAPSSAITKSVSGLTIMGVQAATPEDESLSG
jgi:hypothetical protein